MPWYNCQWAFRKRITINHTRVAADLTDFPVLINLASDADLAARALDNGNDLLFTAADQVTKLSHEIERFDGITTGQLVAWVKVPHLSSTADTVLYLYYGNPAAANQQNVANVWDANFRGVWHLAQDPSAGPGSIRDSTSNANHGTPNGGMTSGDLVNAQIGQGLDFDGLIAGAGGDYIDLGNAPSLQITGTGEVTLQAWAQLRPGNSGVYYGLAGKLRGDGAGHWGGFGLARYVNDYFRFWTADWTNIQPTISDNTWTDTAWHSVVGVRRGGVNYLDIDGNQQANTTTLGIGDSGDYAFIGREYSDYNLRLWNGLIDEVRISNVGRSAAWIRTEFNNQSSPATFHTLGSEELSPKPPC